MLELDSISHVDKSYEHSITIGGVLDQNHKLLLVQDKKGQWGIPAGHAETGEHPSEVIAREISQETGLKKERILVPSAKGGTYTLYWLAKEEKTSVGIVIDSLEYLDEIKKTEWKVDDEDINLARLFDLSEVYELVENPSLIRKASFNHGVLIDWMLIQYNSFWKTKASNPTFKNIRQWIKDGCKEGRLKTVVDPLHYHYPIYHPPNVIFRSGVFTWIDEDTESLFVDEK